MLRLFLLLLTIQNCFSASDFPKCCDSDSVLKNVDSVYNCTEDESHRVEMITNDTNFIQDESDGLCVDIEDTVTLFRLNNSQITKEEVLDFEFYPKCCPIDYFYNATIHGCVKSPTKLETFFEEKFVKVGLPNCKIIVDVKLNTYKHFERLNGSLVLPRQNKVFGNGLYCVERDENQLFIARICHEDYDVCDRIRCVHKCCPDGQSFINGANCRNTYVHGVNLWSFSSAIVDNINDSFVLIHGYNPPVYVLTEDNTFHLSKNGTFMQTETDRSIEKINVTTYYNVKENEYCIEHAVKGAVNKFMFFRSPYSLKTDVKYIFGSVAMTISCIFLALTIIYYCMSKEKQTLFGRTLISYCVASFIGFFLLSYVTFMPYRPPLPICSNIAYVLFYTVLSIFTWMNIMCIDIYWTFGSSKSFSTRQYGSKELKRFILYSLYGWGLPLILTCIVLIFNHVEVLPEFLQVRVDEMKCLIYKESKNYGYFVFSTTPIAIMQLCNLVLFIRTAVYCMKVKKEINKMNDTHAANGDKNQKLNKFQDRFGLLTKLFLIMGISFLFEVVSTFYNFKKNSVTAVIETIWDTFNCLQGLFIFMIFIVKKRIFKKFGKRVGLARLRKFSLVSSATTQTTSLPTLSANHK